MTHNESMLIGTLKDVIMNLQIAVEYTGKMANPTSLLKVVPRAEAMIKEVEWEKGEGTSDSR